MYESNLYHINREFSLCFTLSRKYLEPRNVLVIENEKCISCFESNLCLNITIYYSMYIILCVYYIYYTI